MAKENVVGTNMAGAPSVTVQGTAETGFTVGAVGTHFSGQEVRTCIVFLRRSMCFCRVKSENSKLGRKFKHQSGDSRGKLSRRRGALGHSSGGGDHGERSKDPAYSMETGANRACSK